ncbi:putative ribosome biogenesis GTPase RsgA [Flexivirga endophytica]|uniref:Small ribosomal subunit biogenesis GTPase RsgA n=1 Tax=Flexivirga endophytica TaxID=1849103 RepID=A0A916WMJ1_9MICO|nr:ribosome small subunit-dependent GTPase A [Flexivirga endophytica]GGB14723.1 putative ribosome biogenesis GTPase RsgA [Flexivirga endophytica]GHB65522.1 putative ribosome biogenesis GTPase RsgA [Flexivirga endophytica]
MSPRGRVYDESDVRVRAGRRGSRPRTKERPKHEDARIGQVTTVDRGRWTCLVDGHPVVAMRARELGRTSTVVGDRVALVGDTSGDPGTLARIVRVEPRTSVLRRTADDTDPYERVIVANADQLAIVTALADPEPRPRMVDRCLVAAYDAGMTPLLVLTKSDLADPEKFLAGYAGLDVAHVVTRTTAHGIEGLEQVREALQGRMTVLVGHSGVGKSTLVNELVPGIGRAIGHVNAVTGRGRHTSTSAIALPLPDLHGNTDGWVIDTPGVRSFGLAHIDPDHIIHAFPDLAPAIEDCPRGCTHDEEECALDAWVADGHAGASGRTRLESLRRLLRTRSGDPDAHDSDAQTDPHGEHEPG